MNDFKSRFRGCLLGLATGDAVGTTLEFKQPGAFTPIADMIGGGPFALQAGQWTDDTSMALCLAESLIACQGFDPRDQMQRYVRWWRDGYLSSTGECFDIGNTTQQALAWFQQTNDPMSGVIDPNAAGNGSLMRLAPVPMFFASDPAAAILMSGKSSYTTHGAATAVTACQYFGGLLVGALNGASKDELLSPYYSPIPHYWDSHAIAAEIDDIAAGSFKRLNPPQIVGSGYVVKSLEAALWAFYHSVSFRHGCLLAANLGNDADTTAAIYGQIAGAYYAEDGIPIEWRAKLAMLHKIEKFSDQLFAFSASDQSSINFT